MGEKPAPPSPEKPRDPEEMRALVVEALTGKKESKIKKTARQTKRFLGRHKLGTALSVAAGLHLGGLFHEEVRRGAEIGVSTVAGEARRVWRRGENKKFEEAVTENVRAYEEGKTDNIDFNAIIPVQEYVSGQVGGGDYANAQRSIKDLRAKFKAVAAAEPNRLKVIHEMLQLQHKVDYSSGLVCDFVNGGGNNCEQLVKLELILISEIYPDMPLLIQEMVKSNVPHIRLIGKISNIWYAFDEDTPYPITPKDFQEVISYGTMDYAKSFMGVPVEARQGYMSALEVAGSGQRTAGGSGRDAVETGRSSKNEVPQSGGPRSRPSEGIAGTPAGSFGMKIDETIKLAPMPPKKGSHAVGFKKPVVIKNSVGSGAPAKQGEVFDHVTFEQAQGALAQRADRVERKQKESAVVTINFSTKETTLKERLEQINKDQYEVAFRDKLAKEHHFSFVSAFNTAGVARVISRGQDRDWYLIDKNGKKISLAASYIRPMQEGIFQVILKNSRTLLYSEYGKPIEAFNDNGHGINFYEEGFVGNFAVGSDSAFNNFVVDRQGHSFVYNGEVSFSDPPRLLLDGTLWILPHREANWKHVDKEGKFIGQLPDFLSVVVKHANNHQREESVFVTDNKKTYVYKKDGGWSDVGFDRIEPFYKDRAWAVLGKEYLVIDRDGEVVAGPFPLNAIDRPKNLYFSEGFYPIKLDGKMRFLDKNGRQSAESYDDAWNFSEGLARVSSRGAHTFVDKSFVRVGGHYGWASDFHNGHAVVNDGYGTPYYVIDKSFKKTAMLEPSLQKGAGSQIVYYGEGVWEMDDGKAEERGDKVTYYFDGNGKKLFY
ncbi:MAG: hypothetical protein EXS55_03635 [Candidatus Magasanikbacteria bacterium]|nr:hypothetical protein [Candidatus Magasanikbacteria bacterium]